MLLNTFSILQNFNYKQILFKFVILLNFQIKIFINYEKKIFKN